MITKDDILQATNNGLDVFLRYYPDAAKCLTNRSYKFKVRDEKTPSAAIKQTEAGTWIITDFGDEMKGKNCFTFVMEEENMDFAQMLNFLAKEFNILVNSQPLPKVDAKITSRPATDTETEGYYYDFADAPTEQDITNILAAKTIEYLGKDWYSKAKEIFLRYNFKVLTSYSIVKVNKQGQKMYYTFSATDSYPLYIWICKDFKKIYRPKETEHPRFIYDGRPTPDFLFGYDVAHRAWQELTNISDDNDDEDDAPKKRKPQKLNYLTLCSGGSDALNLACFGHYPIWMNSETAILTTGQYKSLNIIADTIYNLPDIDTTGLRKAHELAMEYLDIHTIYLPMELSLSNAPNRKPKKDLRDYLATYRAWSYFDLLKVAYPYRFWEEKMQFDKQGEFTGVRYDVRNKRLYNFLERNGFYRYKSETTKDGYIFIQIVGSIVREITAKDIRDFINDFLESRKMDDKLLDTFLRTTQLSEGSLSNIKFKEIDFIDSDHRTQWFFYPKTVVSITKEEIKHHKPGTVHKYVWEKEVIPHHVKESPPQFEIKMCEDQSLDISLHNPCQVLNYLTNASRMFWRKELEELQPKDAKLRAEYAEKYKFAIDGPALDNESIAIQKLHLINKIYSIGFLLHTYKNSSKAWAVWAMDNKISDANESHGGSGKSVCYKGLLHLKNHVQLEGRNPKLIDNPHVYENFSEHTDLVLVDDASRYIKFDFFFSAITGPISVNPKNNKQFSIPFADSPKMIFTSNFPPYNADPSTDRRLLYTVFSDYYHFNRLGEYNEERKVSDDFNGKNLFDDFDQAEWNNTLNFYMQCVQFYLSTNNKISPPLENVTKRSLKSVMGDNFQDWADVYFSKESGKLDTELVKEEAQNDCKRTIGLKVFTPQQFKHSLTAWCQYNGYELNPIEFLGNATRKTKRVKEIYNNEEREVMKEVIYIQTKAIETEPLPF